MNKKNICIISIIAVAILGAVGYFVFGQDKTPQDGIYKVENFPSYPDAYIEIKEGTAQFFNIDLNTVYKDKFVERYINYLTNSKDKNITEDDRKEIEAGIDLNKMFCDKSFSLDFSAYSMQDEENHNLYYYTFGTVAGHDQLLYSYDTKEKRITVSSKEIGQISFKK